MYLFNISSFNWAHYTTPRKQNVSRVFDCIFYLGYCLVIGLNNRLNGELPGAVLLT